MRENITAEEVRSARPLFVPSSTELKVTTTLNGSRQGRQTAPSGFAATQFAPLGDSKPCFRRERAISSPAATNGLWDDLWDAIDALDKYQIHQIFSSNRGGLPHGNQAAHCSAVFVGVG
jgi:hypothetical protein